MLFETQYDLVFGIGGACSCTQILRKCCLQFNSYPYDWLFGSDILTRVKILSNNYKDFINFEDFEDAGYDNNDKNNLCEAYHNKNNDITFNHDFAYDKPLAETYDAVKQKYDRRIKRQISQIENSENVLVVYLQPPHERTVVDNETLIKSHDVLQTRFSKQNITLLYVYCNHGKKDASYKEIQKGIIKTEYDYDAYDANIPYAVNDAVLQKQFCKLKITRKFITKDNLYKRYIYLIKCFFRGML